MRSTLCAGNEQIISEEPGEGALHRHHPIVMLLLMNDGRPHFLFQTVPKKASIQMCLRARLCWSTTSDHNRVFSVPLWGWKWSERVGVPLWPPCAPNVTPEPAYQDWKREELGRPVLSRGKEAEKEFWFEPKYQIRAVLNGSRGRASVGMRICLSGGHSGEREVVSRSSDLHSSWFCSCGTKTFWSRFTQSECSFNHLWPPHDRPIRLHLVQDLLPGP